MEQVWYKVLYIDLKKIDLFNWEILWIGLVAQRITRLTTDQKIAGSNPAEFIIFFCKVNPVGPLSRDVSSKKTSRLRNIYGAGKVKAGQKEGGVCDALNGVSNIRVLIHV